MHKSTKNTLSGLDNKKLNTVDSTNREDTAAWANRSRTDKTTNVNIPAEYDVEKAKNWVDNGSQL